MAKEGSVAPKERINVTFKPATGGAQEEIELEQAGLLLKPVADLPPATICAHVAESSDKSVMHWVKHMASVLGAAATS